MKLPLNYILQPARIASDRLMIVLHGRGDSAAGFEWLQDELDMESLNYLLLNAPNRYYTGYSWYDLPPDQLPGIRATRKLLAEVLAETHRNGYPTAQTFLCGFSQGCLLTLEFGARFEHALAGYIGISGYCYDATALVNEMNPAVNRGNWLITHGTEDELLPIESTRAQMQQLIAAGFKIDYREYRKGHTIDLVQELPEIREWLNDRSSID